MVDCPLPRLFFADIKEVAPSHSQTFMKLLGIHTQSKEDAELGKLSLPMGLPDPSLNI